MIKRVNFTGRRRISRSCIQIEVHDGSPRTFDVQIDISTTQMPADSRIFLEAMCAGSSIVKRFDFGTVASIIPPSERTLDEIEGEKVFFALKVVDETESIGRILGIAEQIYPSKAGKLTSTGRRGILPIDAGPLQQEVWKLDFREHEVFLIVNENIPGLKERARWDPLFFASVYPAIVRMILNEAGEWGASVENEDDNWPTLWLQFGHQLHPERAKPPSKEDSQEDWKEWVDEVVSAFAESHTLRDEFAKALPQTEGEES